MPGDPGQDKGDQTENTGPEKATESTVVEDVRGKRREPANREKCLLVLAELTTINSDDAHVLLVCIHPNKCNIFFHGRLLVVCVPGVVLQHTNTRTLRPRGQPFHKV